VFEASHPFLFFDYFRVPYQVQPLQSRAGAAGPPGHRLAAAGQSRALWWLDGDSRPAGRSGAARLDGDSRPGGRSAGARLGRYRLRDSTFFGHVALGTAVPAALNAHGQGWEPVETIFDADTRHVASVWRDRQGSIFLPFDPGEVMSRFWSESYQAVGCSALAAAARAAAIRGY
jgi:hypothetical protein